MAFILVAPSKNEYHMFLLSEKTITLQSFWYYMYEHLGYVVVAIVFYIEIPKYKIAYLTFLFVQVGDAIDFWVIYNDEWWVVNGVPITYNLVRIAIFGLSILVAIINERRTV